MYIKIHESYRKVVAICDEEVVGKTFEEGNRLLDVKESFYKGDEIEEERVVERLRQLNLDDATFNIVGEKAIKGAIDAGIVSEENVSRIQNIPFALVLI